MSDEQRVVQMSVVNPGKTGTDGDFNFEMQPRYNSGRIVKFALIPSDAEQLQRHLAAYLKEQQKK